MTAIRTTIRPRTRTAEALTPSDLTAANTAGNPQPLPNQDKPSFPVLARLPDVSLAAEKGKLAIRLDWLTQLDWKKMRRLKLDPNWVAGGVLSLVMILLVVITLNRGSKPAADSPGEQEAASWQDAQAHEPAGQGSSIGESALTKQPVGSPLNSGQFASPGASGLSGGQNTGVAPSQPVADAIRSSLEGIYYPRTPHAAPDSNVFPAAAQATAHPAAPGDYDNGIRTAQRDPFVSRAPQPSSIQPAYVQPAHSQAGHAQFDGFITQPHGTRNP
jgi:hypothetical protein